MYYAIALFALVDEVVCKIIDARSLLKGGMLEAIANSGTLRSGTSRFSVAAWLRCALPSAPRCAPWCLAPSAADPRLTIATTALAVPTGSAAWGAGAVGAAGALLDGHSKVVGVNFL